MSLLYGIDLVWIRKERRIFMNCPLCGSIDTGKVSTNQYYCWNCLVEFNMGGPNGFTAYNVDEEGTLVAINALQPSQAGEEQLTLEI
jgi:hypothetical protein